MENIDVSVVLLNYNTLSFTKQCVESIIENTNVPYEIIVVENNSSDNDKTKEIEKQYVNTRVIISETNLGFGGGNNLGVRNAKGKYIVILNNDTIVYPKTIDNVKKILDDSDGKTIITGFIEGPDQKLQHSGGKEPQITGELLRFGFLLIKYFPNKYYNVHYFFPCENSGPKNMDWASGCFFAQTREFYNELGGFDERMFMYFEDVEFHKRVRAAGGKITFRPEIKIKHFGSQSSKNHLNTIIRSQYKNTIYYFNRHSGKSSAVLFHLSSKILFFIWYSVFVLLGTFAGKENVTINSKKDIYKTLLFA